MALRPGRQRSSATPITTKGVVPPLQNPRASKSATHGFASKSDTRHSKKHLLAQVLFATKSAAGGRNPPAVDEICLTAGCRGGFNFI